MVQARLISHAVLAASLIAAVTLEPGRTLAPEPEEPFVDERDADRVEGVRAMDVSELYETAPPEVVYDGALQVDGAYRMTGAKVALPGSPNAIRVIEFTRESEDGGSPD